MRYLALLLLAPWLLILAWVYFTFPRGGARTMARRLFDLVALLLAALAAVGLAAWGFEAVPPAQIGAFGRPSGAIWQQVLPVLVGYGGCVGVLALAALVRQALWRGGRRWRQTHE